MRATEGREPTGEPLEALGRLLAGGPVHPWLARVAAAGLLVALSVLVMAAWRAPVRNNPASRVGTIECLVDHHDWSLNRATHRYVTTDKVLFLGRFYSSKPPVYAATGAALYATMQWATGATIAEDTRRAVFGLRLLLHIVPFLIGAVAAGRFLRRRVEHDGVWLWGMLAFTLGTFVFGYSADINNHALAALLVLASLIGASRLIDGSDGWLLWLGTGLCAALAATFDLGAAVAAIALAALLAVKARRRGWVWFIVGAELPILLHVALTLHISGTLLPFYGRDDLYEYPGSYWSGPRDFDALQEPTGLYAFHALLGHHGLLSMTPLFFLAVPGFVLMARRRAERGLGVWLGATCALTVGTYVTLGPRNYGGTAQGMRWFIILSPLLWFAALRWADAKFDRRWMRLLLPAVVLIGIVHAWHAVDNPWSVSPWNWWLRRAGLGSVPQWDWD